MKNNPIRRNRNIGTAKSGHGQNNSMRIPESWNDDRVYWSKVVNPVFLTSTIGAVQLTIIVEPTKNGYAHHVTPTDIEKILCLIGEVHLDGLAAIVLKQPKKKVDILDPVWGRFLWQADIGNASGPMIMLDAQKIGKAKRRGKSLTPEGAKELDRLKMDGHQITSDKRYHYIECSADAVRNTQLYRTLLHELGHYEDYRVSIADKDNGDIDYWFRLVDEYDRRTTDQKEQFAHQFAEKTMHSLRSSGSVPFDAQIDEEVMLTSELSRAWFATIDT